LRSPRLKKMLPQKTLLAAESALQTGLAKSYFGPSTVFLVRKPE
jgi:hypothetical protein